jgi:hypothetical protein
MDARRIVRAIAEFFAGFETQSFDDQRRILRAAFKEFQVENNTIPAATLNGAFLASVVRAKVEPPSRWRWSLQFPMPTRLEPLS